jgi:hypothetical protein
LASNFGACTILVHDESKLLHFLVRSWLHRVFNGEKLATFTTIMLDMDNDTKLDVSTTQAALADTPLVYCGKEVVCSDWSARMWCLYHYEWGIRPLYKVPMTAGFARGVTNVHDKLKERHKLHRVITSKPFLCITSRGDDVLKASETLSRAD